MHRIARFCTFLSAKQVQFECRQVQIECSRKALGEHDLVDPLDLSAWYLFHQVPVGVEREPGRLVPHLPGDIQRILPCRDQEACEGVPEVVRPDLADTRILKRSPPRIVHRVAAEDAAICP